MLDIGTTVKHEISTEDRQYLAIGFVALLLVLWFKK